MALQQLDLWQPREDQALRPSPATTPRRRSSAALQLVPATSAAPAIARHAAAWYYLENALAPRTREAYASDWKQFERWCIARNESPLPAAVATLADYLADLAQQGRKASTIRRARKAIGAQHAELGLPRPDRDGRIRRLERGIGRIHGTRERGPAPLLIEDLARVVHTLDSTTRHVPTAIAWCSCSASPAPLARATSLHSTSNTSRFIPIASPCICRAARKINSGAAP